MLASKSLITDIANGPVDDHVNDLGLQVIHQDLVNDIANDHVKDLVNGLGLQVNGQRYHR